MKIPDSRESRDRIDDWIKTNITEEKLKVPKAKFYRQKSSNSVQKNDRKSSRLKGSTSLFQSKS